MEITKQTRKSKAADKIAKGIIWGAAGLTIIILVWIIGYIMVKGFYYKKWVLYDVLPVAEEVIAEPDHPEREYRFIVNKKIRIKDMMWIDLKNIYTAERRDKWGFYSQQNIKIDAVSYKSGNEKNFIDDSGKFVSRVKSPEEMVRKVAETKSAIGFVPAVFPVESRKVKTVPVRRISVTVHPSVTEVVDNRFLTELNEEQVRMILTGEADNWSLFTALDLAIKPVIYLPTEGAGKAFNEYYGTEKNSVIHVLTDKDIFINYMKDTPGAVGFCFIDTAREAGLTLIPTLREESGANLTFHFLVEPPSRSGEWGGISYVIINTLLLIFFTLLVSTPIGIAAAVYLVEYSKQNRLVKILRMGTETLAGIPSIIFGLFGYIFFVQILKLGIGFISSTLSVTLMILPTIIRTSEEALLSVPATFREGSYALGASRLETIIKVIIPAASPGILTGVILAIGRTVGETAVLLYTLGSNLDLVKSATSSARVLSLHLYLLFAEAISFERAFATGAVLIFIVLIVNLLTTRLIGRINRFNSNA